MTMKLLATSAAVAAIGAAAAGVTSIAPGMASSNPAAPQVQPVVFSAPLPLDQTTTLPTAGQLSGVLNGLADPGVPFANKAGLVEGGISPMEANLADHQMKKAAKKGELPLTFNVSNIQPAGPGAASADVAVSGPKLTAPVMQSVTFVNQGGSWLLSRGSAMSLLQAASGH